jgi:hypothetical protein
VPEYYLTILTLTRNCSSVQHIWQNPNVNIHKCLKIYINDLTTNILEAETVLFADNTNILIQAEDGKVLEHKIISTMEVLYNWFDTNGLVKNTEKSIALSFHTWQNKIPLKPRIMFNNRDVNYSTEAKFLCLHLTECLKWEAHIRYLSIKLNKSFFVLQSLKYTTGTNIWRSMYFAHFYSYERYGVIFGGNYGKAKKFLSFKRERYK